MTQDGILSKRPGPLYFLEPFPNQSLGLDASLAGWLGNSDSRWYQVVQQQAEAGF